MKALLLLGALVLAGAAQDVDGDKALPHVDKPPAKRRPGTSLGLLLTFHGANGNQGSLVGKAEEMLQKAGVRDDYVVIGLKSKEVGWTDKDDEPVKKFIPWAIKAHGIDPRRVYGFGVSSGAWYLNRFAPANSDLLAGAISYVGGMGQPPKGDAPTTAELYWVIGHKDDTLPPSRVRPQAEAYFKAGFRAVYHEMLDHAHEGPKDPTQDEAVAWMRALRSKRVAPAGDDLEFLKKLEDPARAASALGSAATWMRLAAIGGPHAAPAVLQGLASDRAGVRANAAQACAQVMFDGKVVDALLPLLEDKDVKARRTSIAALAVQGRWNYPQAIVALCGVARDEKKPEGDRRAAAQGLADVVRIDLLGTYLQKEAIWTLVGLLGDRDGALRAAAFLALQGAQADGFGYLPAMTDVQRAKSLQRWTEWAEKVCGPKG